MAHGAFSGPQSGQGDLLDVKDLGVSIPHPDGDIHAVRNVSLKIRPSERVAILGESGCGKTMTALSLVGLQPEHAILRGSIRFDRASITLPDLRNIERIVRRKAGIVFQDSLSSLNPVVRIGKQLSEALELRGWKRRDAFAEATRMLARVGMPDPEARMRSYPHELSGGMRQRVLIAMSLLASPILLIADEPTTALDTTVQAQVTDLIRSIQAETRMGLLLITHDLAMAAELCDRAVIMYAGYVVEDIQMAQLLRGPRHPYARALLEAMPRLDTPADQTLATIPGELPSPRETFDRCPFSARCQFVDEVCLAGVPELRDLGDGTDARCVRPLSEDGVPSAPPVKLEMAAARLAT